MPQIQNSETSLSHLQTQVVEDAKWVDKVLMSGTFFIGIIVFIKFLNLLKVVSIQTFDWGNIQVSITNVWLIFFIICIFTVAHFYTGFLLLVKSTHKMWEANSDELGITAFEKVVETCGIYVRGLIARTQHHKNTPLVYKMDLDDPSALVSHGAAILFILAILPWDFSNLRLFFICFILAIILTIVNWLVGGTWIVALSELTLEHDKATYHLRVESKKSGSQAKQAKTGSVNDEVNHKGVSSKLVSFVLCSSVLFNEQEIIEQEIKKLLSESSGSAVVDKPTPPPSPPHSQ